MSVSRVISQPIVVFGAVISNVDHGMLEYRPIVVFTPEQLKTFKDSFALALHDAKIVSYL